MNEHSCEHHHPVDDKKQEEHVVSHPNSKTAKVEKALAGENQYLAEQDRLQAMRAFKKKFPEAEFHWPLDCGSQHELHTDFDMLLNHIRCFPEEQSRLLRIIYRKITYRLKNGDRGYWGDLQEWGTYYAERMSALVMTPYQHRIDCVLCGWKTKSGRSSACHVVLICPRCCAKFCMLPAQDEFGNSFGKTLVTQFLTLSCSRNPDRASRLKYVELDKGDTIPEFEPLWGQEGGHRMLPFSDPLDCLLSRNLWDIFRSAIYQLCKKIHHISGAFLNHELAPAFGPLRVLPHTHAVVYSDGFCKDQADDFLGRLEAAVDDWRPRQLKDLYPCVVIYTLSGPEDLKKVLRYMFKPIAFEYPYLCTMSTRGSAPEERKCINRELEEFLENLHGAFLGMIRTVRIGICHPRAKGYIGQVTEPKLAERARWKERQERRLAETKKDFPAFKLRRNPMSKGKKRHDAEHALQQRSLVKDGTLPPDELKKAKHKKRRKRRAR